LIPISPVAYIQSLSLIRRDSAIEPAFSASIGKKYAVPVFSASRHSAAAKEQRFTLGQAQKGRVGVSDLSAQPHGQILEKRLEIW
jgi:hypothetical protein